MPQIVETQPELLAHHYAQAGLIDDAIAYGLRAGRRSAARSANEEAIRIIPKHWSCLGRNRLEEWSKIGRSSNC